MKTRSFLPLSRSDSERNFIDSVCLGVSVIRIILGDP